MRIPYSIPQQTFRTYDCSRETGQLAGEFRRRLKAESAQWDRSTAAPLKQLAVQALVHSLSNRTRLEALPAEDFQRLLETLSTEVPLELSVPLVPDGVYWKRLATLSWPSTNNVVAEHGGSWRRLVLERRLQQELEDAVPMGPMLDEALKLAALAAPFVRRLRLDRLLQTSGAPAAASAYPGVSGGAALAPLPLAYTPDLAHDGRELHMFDTELDALQEDLGNVLGCLVNLEELDVMFGMHDFEKNLSEPPNPVKVTCCRALGTALSALPSFRRLRVRRSQLHLEKLAGLLEPMHASGTLAELDLSHCYLGDKGMQVVAAFLKDQSSLRVLRVVNNKFGARGATHLAKALLNKSCPPLAELDVSLNSMGDVGGHNILMAAVPREHRAPLRDPADDEYVRELMQAEEKERQRKAASEEEEASHEGITVFRGLVLRAIAGGELLSATTAPGTAAAAEDDAVDWEVDAEEEEAPRPSALLALIAEARHHHQEEVEAAEVQAAEERRRREAAAKAAERWEGCPERLRALGVAACRLGPDAGRAAALLLRTNRVLGRISLANNHLGQEACSDVVQALRTNPRVLQLDLRMCGAAWADQMALERALAANNVALRKPMPLRDMLTEREAEYRLLLATSTEVLGRQWERAQGLPRGQRSSVAVGLGLPQGAASATATTGSGSTGGFSGLTHPSGVSSAGNSVLDPTLASTAGRSMQTASSHSHTGSGMGSVRSDSKLAESTSVSHKSHPSDASKTISSRSPR